MSVKVTLDGQQPLKTVYCPSHDAEVRRDGERRAVVGWEARDAWPDTDFKVIFSRTADPLGIDLLAHRQAGERGLRSCCWPLPASPPTQDGRRSPRMSASCWTPPGSMAAAKLDQAKKALRFCLANLGDDDRFEIVRFSTEAEAAVRAA